MRATTRLDIGDAWRGRVAFVVVMWLASRALVVVAMQLVAPALTLPPGSGGAVPTSGWELFTLWDGRFYRQIAESGYALPEAGAYSPLAFFPLYPALTRAVMALGVPFAVGGTLVNSAALLAAMFQMYGWAAERYGVSEARWSTAVVAWFPYSLFGTVTYTEGLFLLGTIASLRAFDRGQHGRCALWGAVASATRVPGILLMPSLLAAARAGKRGKLAYLAALSAGAGLAAYATYCAVRFGNPLAFAQAQGGWEKDAIHWGDVLRTLRVKRLLAPDSVLRIAWYTAAAALFWTQRRRLGQAALYYGWASLGLFLFVNVQSIGRFVYGIATFPLALGIVLAGHRRAGWCVLGGSALMLLAFSIRWAWGLWVA